MVSKSTKKDSKKDRPSPSQSATNYPVGSRLKGNDGNLWEVSKTVLGVNRWKKIGKSESGIKKSASKSAAHSFSKPTSKSKLKPKGIPPGKKYYTHDNGANPFLVIVSQDEINIFKSDVDTKEYKNKKKSDPNVKDEYKKRVKKIDSYQKVFIGKDKINKYEQPGNSILVKVSPREYVYIGDKIYSFKTTDEIIYYKSNMDALDDVPYPFAVGEKFTYLMLENVAIPNELLNDPYYFYYQLKSGADKRIKKMKVKK